MGYVGNQQTEGFSQVPAKQDLTGATGTSLTLTHAVASAEGIDLFINNVRQEPTTAYSVGGDGVTVTLTGSVVATDDIYVVYNSLARQTSTHPSNQALQATSGTFSGDLTVDTNTFHVDSTNNRVGIGTSSPNEKVTSSNGFLSTGAVSTTARDGAIVDYSSSIGRFVAGRAGGNYGQWEAHVAGASGVTKRYQIDYDSTTRWYAADGTTERMRIDSSGNVLVGTTSAGNGYGNNNAGVTLSATRAQVFSNSSGDYGLVLNKTSYQSGSTCYQVNFRTLNQSVGGIFTNNSSTTYATTSDYRLKENVVADWDATTRLKQLNPVRFNFIADADITVDGFLAHEVQTVVPEAISGTHDEVDDEGNPVYQGIDQSKLVPLLVKTIQELEARIAALEAS